MRLILFFLILCNILVPLFFTYRKCISKQGVEVNHILAFSLGFVFYWVVPILIGHFRLFLTISELDIYYQLYYDVPQHTVIIYQFVSLCFYIAFCLGSLLEEKISSKAILRYKNFFFDQRLLNLYLISGLCISGYFIWTLRDELFVGYTGRIFEDFGLRGSLSAASFFLLSLAFIHSHKIHEKHIESLKFSKLILNRFFIVYFIISFMFLSMGGRLPFVSSILMICVYKSVFFRKIQIKTFLAFITIIVIFSAFFGILRQGTTDIRTNKFITSLFGEPLFVSLPLLSFLKDWKFDLIRFPIFLFNGFLNLIPTVVLPSKEELLIDPARYGYPIYSPLGGLHSFFSFMINFGIIGTIVVIFLFSMYLSFLKRRKNSVLSSISYIMLSGFVAFTFFRDSFNIAVIKSMFQFSILMPFLTVLSLHILSFPIKKGLVYSRAL